MRQCSIMCLAGLVALIGLVVVPLRTEAVEAKNWSAVLAEARGQTVDVYAWAGEPRINAYLAWAGQEIEARFETNDQATVRLSAPSGVYDSGHEKMRLNDDVRIVSSKGLDMRMRNADLDFKAGSVSSDEEVTVVTGTGTIVADRLRVGDNGKRVSFEGNVRSSFSTSPAAGKGSEK